MKLKMPSYKIIISFLISLFYVTSGWGQTAVCNNFTLTLDGSGGGSITAADIDAGSTGDGPLTLSVSPNSFSCADLGANTVTLTVMDTVGTTSCDATVTVVDDMPPTAQCITGLTIYLESDGTAEIEASDIDNGSSDNCTISNSTLSQSTFDCSNIGDNTVVLTVTDQSGNMSTCTTTVTVVDDISPTAQCLNNLTVYLESDGTVEIEASDIDNGSSDNCTISNLTLSQSTFDCSNIGDNTVVLAVTDQSGNMSTCTTTVSISPLEIELLPLCLCNNDASPNLMDGTYTSTVVVRSGTQLPSNLDIQVQSSSGAFVINSNVPIPSTSPLAYCNGNNCPDGVNEGEYYLTFTSSDEQAISMTVEEFCSGTELVLTNEECNDYPAIPTLPQEILDSLFCVDEDFSLPANGGFFSISNIPEDAPILPAGFEQMGDQLFITSEEVVSGPVDLYLHLPQTNMGNGISDICYSTAYQRIEVLRGPELGSRHFRCLSEGDSIFLSSLLTTYGTEGGLFYVEGQLVDEGVFKPTTPGCYTLTFDPDICNFNTVSTDFLVSFEADPELDLLSNISGPVCQDGGTYDVIVRRNSDGGSPSLSVTSSEPGLGFTVNGDINVQDVTISLDAPTVAGGVDYLICLEETTDVSIPCDTFDINNTESCVSSTCVSVTLYNDGFACGADALFDSECELIDPPSLCPTKVIPSLNVQCAYIELELFDIIEAKVEKEQAVYDCSVDFVSAKATLNLPGILGDAVASGPRVGSLPGMNVVCKILNWRLRISFKVVGKRFNLLDLKPFGDLGEGCDDTIGQLILRLLSKALGGDGGGGFVAADTDGDGAFDYIEEIPFGVSNKRVSVPNKIKGNGYVTFRTAGGWPFKAASLCGGVVKETINLLDLLPIASIPIVGPPVEDALQAAQCDVNLVFSASDDVQIPIFDVLPPEFFNCQESGYEFFTSVGCDIPADWALPMAFEDCKGTPLNYKGITSNVDLSNYNGPAIPTVASIQESGIYQTQGPAPGSILPPGIYPVTYTAAGCSGNFSSCSFNVRVTIGDPVLEVPRDMTFNNDVNQWTAIGNGLAPLQGIGCLSTLNYSYTNPITGTLVSTSSTTPGVHNVPDGNVFEMGTTEVSYTLTADNNGNGVIEANETQTQSFNITVQDVENPVAQCRDVTAQLDNEGNVVVFARNPGNGEVFIDGGSTDNSLDSIIIEVSRDGNNYGPSVSFDCSDIGSNVLNMRVTDQSGNSSLCIAEVLVENFFKDYVINLNLPEICLDPFQDTIDLAPYVTIDLPDGTSISPSSVPTLGDEVFGQFYIEQFLPDPDEPFDEGEITEDGIYTPGQANGYARIGYVIAIADDSDTIPIGLPGCYQAVTQVVRIQYQDPSWSSGALCCDAPPVWLGGASNTIPAGLVSLEDIGGGYPEDIGGSWEGEGVSFVDPDQLPFSGDEYYQFNPAGLDGTYNLTYQIGREVCVFSSSQSMRVTCQPLQVSVSDVTVCPASVVDEIEILTSFNDYDLEVTTTGMAALGGTDLVDEPVENGRAVIQSFNSIAVRDQDFPITVITSQTNVNGCADTIMFNITVQDLEAPQFVNCPRPNIVQDAETGLCDAFVTFSLPFVEDNCDPDPLLEKVDTTGLTSGDRFPVGLTTLIWVATDTVGNFDTCEIKVLVEDLQKPELICPADSLTLFNDPGICGATVNDVTPEIEDNCTDNSALIYRIFDQTGGLIERGLGDVSGKIFPVGNNRLEYVVFDQPLALITEVIQADTISGIEIGNFGPNRLDISCATLRRVTADTTEEFMIPNLTFLLPGQVYTHEFSSISSTEPAEYVFEFVGRLLDQVDLNSGGLSGPQVIRNSAVQQSMLMDFDEVHPCNAGSYGDWNPNLDFYPANGVTATLQSYPANSDTCSIQIEVLDVEAPVCGMHDSLLISSMPLDVDNASCFNLTFDVGPGKVSDVNIIDLDIDIPNAGAVIANLISPSGTQINLIRDLCDGQPNISVTLDDGAQNSIADANCAPLGNGLRFRPLEAFDAFCGEQSEGEWMLQVYLEDDVMATINNADLQILNVEDYTQEDIVMANDSTFCGAIVEWNHPVFDDNCCKGTMSVEYSFSNAVTGVTSSVTEVLLDENVPVDLDGEEVTRYFEVGVTEVIYTLVDQYGNTSTCGFTVTINDTEPPVFTNGCPDLVANLDGGECYASISSYPEIMDNCEFDTLIYYYDDGSLVDLRFIPIGVNNILIVAFDIYGNPDTCAFTYTVNEFIPSNNSLTCNNGINLSLDPNCEAVITADMMLEGGPYRCYENYCIEITDADGNSHPNLFNLSDVGQTFEVSVVDCMHPLNNSCWGEVTIEQKLIPEIECPADTTLRCNVDLADLNVVGDIEILSCAPNAVIEYEDEVVRNLPCGDTVQVIDRTFTVVTDFGNITSCTQRIVVLGFNFDDIEFPEDITYLDPLNCNEVAMDPTLTEPESTGFPTIDGEVVIGNTGVCQLNVGYWDEILQDADCANSYELLRHWIIRDECRPLEPGVNPLRHIQAIKVEDIEPPIFNDLVDITISSELYTCQGQPYTLPSPVSGDACGDFDIEYQVSYGLVSNGQILGLQFGETEITVVATDACGNTATDSYIITVVDDVEPIAICDQNTKVSLDVNGEARVHWSTIDDGSYDNCGIDRIEVRRMDQEFDCEPGAFVFKEFVDFCCADIERSPVQVLFRVTDVAGNENTCMVSVNVEDKLPPAIVPPSDLTISCTYPFDEWNLDEFGVVANLGAGETRQTREIYDEDYERNCLGNSPYDPTVPTYEIVDGFAEDNCSLEVTSDYNDEREDCGTGVIVRTFRAVDDFGNSSTAFQRITIEQCTPFTESDIDWPSDRELACDDNGEYSTDPEATGEPEISNNNACTQIAVRFEDELFEVTPDACFKILRTWTVLDWCQYDEQTGAGQWTYTQTIKVNDDETPELMVCDDVTFCDSAAVGCEGFASLVQEVEDCTPEEFLNVEWRVKPFNAGNNPNDDIVGTGLDASGMYPFGTHRITWIVEDMCGNVGTCQYLFTVEDCKLPTPVVINGLATVVMPSSGCIDIEASLFDAGSFDNCGEVVMSYSSDTSDNVRTFCCEDTIGVKEVEFWVTDESGNQDFVVTYIDIQDPNGVCPPIDSNSIVINGQTATHDGLGVEDVEVYLEDMDAPTPITRMTDGEGFYQMYVNAGPDYRLTPYKNDDVLNGVNTMDILLIQQHILGLNPIENPYELIAANVNDDARITGAELIELRRAILGIDEEFANNTSWRFVNIEESLEQGVLPQNYAETIEMYNATSDQLDQDFVAVKIGDVDGTAIPSSLDSREAEGRSGALILTALDAAVETGERVELAVTSAGFSEVLGYQMTLNYGKDVFELVDVRSGALDVTEGNYGVFAGAGKLTMSWNETEAVSYASDEVLFTLVFKAQRDVRLSDALEISDAITPTEAYVSGETRDMVLRFTTDAAEFALYQNVPNPFESKTVIGFNLPEAGDASLTFYDAAGQVVHTIENAYKKGYNEETVDSRDIPANGLYYYELRSGDFQATKKMVISGR